MATRTSQTVSATANANGAATFEFDPPPRGYVITGSIGIPAAPSSAVSTLTIGPGGIGTTWGSWAGNATFGPVQAFGQEGMSIVATGLAAGGTYDAVFIGYSEEELPSTLIIYPAAFATTVSTNPVSPFSGARLTKSGLTSVPNNTFTNIPFDVESFDTDGYHTGSDASFVIPSGKAGTYLLIASIQFDTNTTGMRYCLLDRAGVIAQTTAKAGPGQPTIVLISTLARLAVGDIVAIQGWQDSGGPLDVTAGTGSRYEIVFLG